jgi:hypothetical protein
MSPRCMETNRNIVANAETGVPAEDFAERVRVNQAKPTSELTSHTVFRRVQHFSSHFRQVLNFPSQICELNL